MIVEIAHKCVFDSSFLSDDTVRMVGGHIAALGNNCELIRLPGAVTSATTKLVKKTTLQ